MDARTGADTELSAFDVLAIAERIERNGEKFYRKAGELTDDVAAGKVFHDLARWEAKHAEIFRDMKQHLSQQRWELGTFEPSKLDVSGAQVMAGLAVFAVGPDPAADLTGSECRDDIFRIAIQKERDSIVYYAGLRAFVPAAADRAVVEEIIKEEMRHVRILQEALEQR
jgi:rubrerythrin